jgi:hypothetical protein
VSGPRAPWASYAEEDLDWGNAGSALSAIQSQHKALSVQAQKFWLRQAARAAAVLDVESPSEPDETLLRQELRLIAQVALALGDYDTVMALLIVDGDVYAGAPAAKL